MSRAQSFIQIGSEHTHEGNIDHVLCNYRRIAVRPQQRRVLGGSVGHGHPGGIVLEFFNLREALPKESGNVLGRSLESGIVQLLRKGKHGLLILLQRVSQLRQHRQCPKQGFALFVFRVRQNVQSAAAKDSAVFDCVVQVCFRENPLNPTFHIGHIHIGKGLHIFQKLRNLLGAFPRRRKQCRIPGAESKSVYQRILHRT